MTEKSKKDNNMVVIRGASGAKISKKPCLAAFLESEEEYSDLGNYIPTSDDFESTIEADVAAETKIESVSNVMNLLYMDIKGYGTRFIASQLGVDVADVKKIRASDAYNTARGAILSKIVEQSRRIMEVSTVKAVKTLTECMNSSNDKVRLSAATEVLDRVGLKAAQKVEVTSTGSTMETFTNEQLMEILGASVTPDGSYEVLDEEDEEEDDGTEDFDTEDHDNKSTKCSD